jgi:hypothetical protein
VNNDYKQEWINQDEEKQQTDNGTVKLVNHAGNNNLEDNNKGPKKSGTVSHSEGQNAILRLHLLILSNRGGQLLQTFCC